MTPMTPAPAAAALAALSAHQELQAVPHSQTALPMSLVTSQHQARAAAMMMVQQLGSVFPPTQ